MKTRILTSVLTIVAVVAAVSAMTYAFFSDTGTSFNNLFAAGTLDLQLDDNNEGLSQNVSASFGGSSLAPGGSPVTGFVSVHNGGSVSIAEIALGADRVTSSDPGSDGSDLANVLNLTIKTGDDSACTIGDTDQTPSIAAAIGNGLMPLTLTELEGTDYDSLPVSLAPSATKYVCVSAVMQSTAGNNYQGDSVTDNFVFTAHQDVSQ